MRTIGFPISHKENEKRRSIIPEHIRSLKNPEFLFFEKGYGDVLGISDEEYVITGAKICSRDVVLQKDIICDPKIGDADYLKILQPGQTIFGWIHATQNREITDNIIKNKLTAYAWEKMFIKGRHVFWKNNELAGRAAVINAFQQWGRLPIGCNVAVIGNGNTARGAVGMLNMLGANITQYNRHTETLLREEIGNYDVIVNCILWDVSRDDHIIYRDDLKKMKKGSLIIDVSCDRHGGIETSEPTTISQPIFFVDGVMHYAVDHTPSFFYKTFSYENSSEIWPYVEELVVGKVGKVLQDSMIIENGIVLDQEIIRYQKR